MRHLVRWGAVGVAICTAPLSGWACGSSAERRTTARTGTNSAMPPAPVHAGRKVQPRTRLPKASASSGAAATTGSAGIGSMTAAFTKTVLPGSTSIGSDQYHRAIVSAVETGRKRKPQVAEAFAGCIQQILENAGIHTVGEAEKIKRNPSGDKPVADGAMQCLAAASP